MATTLCNHKRCRKPAIMGFRPYKDGWDITSKVGKQYRCELHSRGLLRDGRPFTPDTWLIPQRPDNPVTT